MNIDPKIIEQARAELAALVDLGKIDFDKRPKPATNRDVFVGIKLRPELYKWVKDTSKQYTRGNVNGFVRSLLEEMQKQEQHTHDNNQKKKRISG
jgi:hypothetical protein